jgi:hypothetical protein
MANCNNCNSEKTSPEAVPYIVHESAMTRAERGSKRLWVVIILLIVLLVGSNGAWLWYESQFEIVETVEVTQENADGYNNYIGNDGDVVNGNPKN